MAEAPKKHMKHIIRRDKKECGACLHLNVCVCVWEGGGAPSRKEEETKKKGIQVGTINSIDVSSHDGLY